MNWANYRRLVDHLKGMDPAQFNYADNPGPADEGFPCGCVETQVELVSGMANTTIEIFLGVTRDEDAYLFGQESYLDPSADDYETLDQDFRATGRLGVTEALRRLAFVAARHVGEPERVAKVAGDEKAFLDTVRRLAKEVTGVE